MFRQFFMGAFVLAAPIVFATDVSGAVVDDLVFFQQNELEDDDWEILVNAGGSITNRGADTSIDENDYLVGMFRITALYVPPDGALQESYRPEPGNETFTGVFALRIEEKGTVEANGRADFSFAPATAAEWMALGIPFTPTGMGTMVIVFDDPDNIDPNAPDTNMNGTNVDESLATVSGTELWELGFDGDPDLFWQANATADFASPQIAGDFNAALNVTENTVGIPLAQQPLLPHGLGFGDAQVLLVGGSVRRSQAGNWSVRSDVDILITPIPESSGLLVWSGVLGCAFVGMTAFRRHTRQRAAAA